MKSDMIVMPVEAIYFILILLYLIITMRRTPVFVRWEDISFGIEML
jgi:hypothetical protein